MTTYEYKCSSCERTWEVQLPMSKYKFDDFCPFCMENKAERVITECLAVFDGNIKSVGMQAEINTRRMGRYELENKRENDKVSNQGANTAFAERITGGKPLKATETPWYRKQNSVTPKQINKMNDKRVMKFIKEGK